MANIKSQEKRTEIYARNNARNNSRKSETKTAIKKVEALVKDGKKEEAVIALRKAISLLDKLAQDGIVSVNGANRKKGQLEAAVAKL